MIRHVVMFDLLPEAEGRTALENAEKIKELLEGLPAKIPQIRRSEVGIGYPGAAPANFHVCLTADFDNEEDLATYIVHPEHVKVGDFVRSVRKSRSCVDYKF